MALDFPNTPVDGEIYEQFYWDATAGIWRNRQIVAELDNLFDVNAPSPLNGDILAYDGTNWVSSLLNAESFGPKFLTETSQKTENYTLQIGDINKVVLMNGSNLTVTVPTNTSVAFPLGTIVNVYNANSTNLTILGASGVTLRNANVITQFRELSMRKRGTNEWVLAGGVL
jgi:hypothetical protein